MATQMGFLSYGVILTLTVLTVLLPMLTTGNAIDQRVLQRELGENSPEMMSMNDKEDFRDIEEPAVDDYTIKTKDIKKFTKPVTIFNVMERRPKPRECDDRLSVCQTNDEQNPRPDEFISLAKEKLLEAMCFQCGFVLRLIMMYERTMAA
ncbi:hypothetical protein ACI65C_000919 [Semiaphis heraclei]